MNLYSIFPTPVAKFELGREYTPEEMAKAEELMRTKFLTEEWTNRIP